MKVVYHIFVNGIPRPQPRPRKGMHGNFYSNSETVGEWKEEIKASFFSCRRPTITTPVQLRVSFFLPKPKSVKAGEEQNVPHDKKPDLDNLLKTVMDAMTDVKVWEDDALVYATDVSKWYAGKKTGAQIIVETKD